MNKRNALLTAAAVLVAGVLLYFAGPCDAPPAAAQTYPSYVGHGLTTGKHSVKLTTVGDRSLSLVQVREPASVQFSFWGRNSAGTWTRICPERGDAAADTAFTVVTGAPVFRFAGIRCEVIVVSAGSADFWGE